MLKDLVTLTENLFDQYITNKSWGHLFEVIPHFLSLFQQLLTTEIQNDLFHQRLLNLLVKYSDYFQASSHWKMFLTISQQLVQRLGKSPETIQLKIGYHCIFHYQGDYASMKQILNEIQHDTHDLKKRLSRQDLIYFEVQHQYIDSAYHRAIKDFRTAAHLADEVLMRLDRQPYALQKSNEFLMHRATAQFQQAAAWMDKKGPSQKEIMTAQTSLKEAAYLFEQGGAERYLWRTQLRLGKTYAHLGDFNHAEKIYTTIPTRFTEKRLHMLSSLYLGQLKLCKHHYEEAKEFLLCANQEAVALGAKKHNEEISALLKKVDPSVTCKSLLTPRESQIGDWLCQGKTAKDMGRLMGISYRTVENHLEKMKTKTGASSKANLLLHLLDEKRRAA